MSKASSLPREMCCTDRRPRASRKLSTSDRSEKMRAVFKGGEVFSFKFIFIWDFKLLLKEFI